MNNPRVYVGTYGKYNSGSLAGGWLSLNECKDYSDFLKKCRALHKGEHDPEFMIQDSEDFPDGLDCMEWLSEQDFNDVKQAIREQEQEEKESGGVSVEDLLRKALLAKLGKTDAPVKVDDEKQLLAEYMAEWVKVWPNDKGMLDYERKLFSGAVRLENGGILFFEKPNIETTFCFHDEGPQYEFYCELMDSEKRLEDYFLHENLDGLDSKIEDLTDDRNWADGYLHTKKRGHRLYVQRKSYTGESAPLNLYYYLALDDWEVQNHPSWYEGIEPMTVGDRAKILAGLRVERDKFEKRLKAYLKRYGTSKLHTWTYWADA